jgi:hypothetical protein
MPKMKIVTNLKEKLKNIPIIHFGKRESLKPEPLTPVKPRPDIDPPKPVEYDK